MKKYLSLNLLSLLGYAITLSWIWQLVKILFSVGNAATSWFAHPVFFLLVLGEQLILIIMLLFLFLIELLLKKYGKIQFEINIKNKFYYLVFKFGYLFLILPYLFLIALIFSTLFPTNINTEMYYFIILAIFAVETALVYKYYFHNDK